MNKKIFTIVAVIIGILALMTILPGEGTKRTDIGNFATVGTDIQCSSNTDCPTCIDEVFSVNKTSVCVSGKCTVPDTCLYWDCGNAEKCVRQTILDNTIQKFNQYPWILFALIAVTIIYIILAIDKR